jgi:hypothetical protein
MRGTIVSSRGPDTKRGSGGIEKSTFLGYTCVFAIKTNG